MAIFIGTAGWSIRREQAVMFGDGPSHLARYAGRFNAVEVNSSFYKPHLPATYVRWAESVPVGFRFSVKMPRTITHIARLKETGLALDAFLGQACSLGNKLGPLLMQLPPSLAYDADVAERFLRCLRERFDGDVVCEPRHASWFEPEAEKMLVSYRIARVAADPAPVNGADEPGGWSGIRYFRCHGSPVIYRSDYDVGRLKALAALMRDRNAASCWCIFDNTADGAAMPNALSLTAMLAGPG